MTHDDVYGREDMALLAAAEAAERDRVAQERGGVPGRVLMENAGRAAAMVIDRLYPRGRIVAAVGSGNNGGDALVALRALRSWGREVAWVPAGSRSPDLALLHGVDVPRIDPEATGAAFASADVVIDGILGTGSAGAPRGRAAEVIDAIARAGRPVVALDVPSGVDPTAGTVEGAAVRAACTITFGWPKQGLLLHPGREHCGRIITVEIGFPPFEDVPSAALITPAWAAARLPPRSRSAHKATVGRVLVLAGSSGMVGAAAILVHAALRAGAGYVRLASDPRNREILQTLVPEAVFLDRGDDAAIRSAAGSSDALVAGPGLGLDDEGRAALLRILEATRGVPTLLDADALTWLAREPDAIRASLGERPLALTPHPGEMARLTGGDAREIIVRPIETARALAERLGCTVLLKGQPSVVAAPGEPVLVSTVGSSDLATAGMGDQLSGTIGAMLAAGAEPRTAAALGLFYSARAADLAARGRSLGPRDVSEHLSSAFADPGPDTPPLGLPFVTFDQPPRR